MSKPKVICISGRARHGKDETGAYLKAILNEADYPAVVMHNADLLKFMCTNLFGWEGDKVGEAKYEVEGRRLNGRELLQYVGTDIVREQEPDIWVNFLIKELDYFGHNWDYAIIPDCRFPNEIERFREEGYETIYLKVYRPDFESNLTPEQRQHSSETALDGYDPDILLINSGTLDDLRDSCRRVLEDIEDGQLIGCKAVYDAASGFRDLEAVVGLDDVGEDR